MGKAGSVPVLRVDPARFATRERKNNVVNLHAPSLHCQDDTAMAAGIRVRVKHTDSDARQMLRQLDSFPGHPR
jgi:hypothetical protein